MLTLTNSPHFYHYLYLAIFLLAAFNISEVAFLLFHKIRIEREELRKEKARRAVADAVIGEADPCSVLGRPADDLDYEAYGEALSSILQSLEGEMAERAVGVIRGYAIDDYYKRMAAGPFWFKRANAVDTLSAFKLDENREFFLAAFGNEKEPLVKYRLIYALSFLARGRSDTARLASMLASLPYLTSKYTEDVFFNVITALKEQGREDDFGGFMLDIMKDGAVPPLVKRDCISACNAAGCEHSRPIVAAYYEAFPDEPEILIACLRSLARLGDASLLPRALRHVDWRVRLTALKHAELCGDDVLPALKDMLRDANYHIRLNAALALSKFGAPGLETLRAESLGADRYAAAAAAYALTLAEAAR